MKRIGALLAMGIVVSIGVALPVQASQAFAKSYESCDALREKFPNGVAKNKKAVTKVLKDGAARPKISAALYKVNGKRLDRDKDGVMCETWYWPAE